MNTLSARNSRTALLGSTFSLSERVSSHEGASSSSKGAPPSPRLSGWPSLKAALRKGGRLHFVKFETTKLNGEERERRTEGSDKIFRYAIR
jgi:hypothetical protein